MQPYYMNGYHYPPVPPPLPPQQREKKQLRREGNYIGTMMLALIAGMQVLFTLLVLLLCLAGVIDFQNLTKSDLGMGHIPYMILYGGTYVAAMALPAVLVAVCFRRRHFPLAPAKPCSGGLAFFCVLAAVGACMFANIATNYLMQFLSNFGVPIPEMPQMMENTRDSLIANLIVIAVLPALVEEMIFRGYVLRALRPYGDVFAVMISSLLFGLMHGNILQMPFAFIVGLVIGWLYVKTDNIWLAVAVHFCNNAVSVLLEYLTFSMTDEKAGYFIMRIIFLLLVLGFVSLIVLIVRYRDVIFRRSEDVSVLYTGQRLGALLTAPVFMIALVGFIAVMILGSMA